MVDSMIDEAALDRVIDDLELGEDVIEPSAVKSLLDKRYSETTMSEKAKGVFAKKVAERTQFFSTVAGTRQIVVDEHTVLAGSHGIGAGRTVMVTDHKGRYFGKPENVTTYTRHGNVYGLNVRTGKRVMISQAS